MTVEIKRAPTHLTLNKLPSLPQVLVRILDAVSQESADFQQLSSIIRQDSAISARLVAVANSSYYRRQHKCDTVDRALMCLGLETVRTLVITASVKQYFSFFDKVHQQFMARFWRRSLVSAHCAQTFASLTGYQNQSQAYLCGLLMDVGQLCLLAENDSAYLALWGPAGSQGELQLLDAERHAFAMTHAELGAALLDSWQMDNFMADAVRYHHATGADVNHAHHLVKIVNLSSLVSAQTDLDDRTLSVANDLFGFNEDLLRELHTRIVDDVRRIAGGLGVAAEEDDPAMVQQASRDLGEKLGQLTQVQALRQTLPGEVTTESSGGARPDAIGRALYLSFGFEKYAIFYLREDQSSLEAWLEGSAVGSGTADFVLAAGGGETLVQRCFNEQRVTSSANQDSAAGLLDEQLLRYCRQPDLICLPFNGKTQRGVLVAGASAETLAQQQANAGLWQALLQQITTLLDSGAEPEAPAQPGRADNEAVRIREAVHEVSNPLSVINNYLEILRLKLGENKDTDREFAILREEMDRVGNILIRLNRPDEQPEAEVVDVNSVVDDLARIFRESMCAARNIEVKLVLDASLAPVVLNKAELKQVLTNLIKNAIEAMPAGGTLTLRSRGKVMVNGRAHLALTVEDTGAGLPEQVLSRLFTPGVTSKGQTHAGLGLSVVKKLMDAMKAQIVCSSGDDGTQFRLLFPAIQADRARES